MRFMSTPTDTMAREALTTILDPITQRDIVSLGWVQSLKITDKVASCILEVDAERASELESVRKAAEGALKSVSGIEIVRVVMTAESDATSKLKPSPTPPPDFPPKPAQQAPTSLKHIDRIIAVASGKGGVGKSTVSSNLAIALANKGQRVGLLDADVYGPSQPRMLGLSERPSSPDGKTIIPLKGHGVVMMSLGLMVGEDEAIAWRGPMLIKALQQMLFQVDWGQLDTLIVDLPPGTGDVQMTLSQKVGALGAVIVSTPQDIALLDARKGIDMFAKMKVPILGLVENMSGFECRTCSTLHYPFGKGGAKAMAKTLNVPFLGEVPLELDVRLAGDEGIPVVLRNPTSAAAQAFANIATHLC